MTLDKLSKILELCQKHDITAYEIGNAINKNVTGIQRILNRTTKKPQSDTLDLMHKYISDKYEGNNELNEDSASYASDFTPLDAFTPEEIITYMYANEKRFLESETYKMFLELKIKEKIIKEKKAK